MILYALAHIFTLLYDTNHGIPEYVVRVDDAREVLRDGMLPADEGRIGSKEPVRSAMRHRVR
jgi:hypothetical protein